MKRVADGVHQISGFPPNAINAFVVGDVLIDALTRHDARRILKALRGHRIEAHALTHAHPDHQGASHAVCDALGIPFWVPEADADAAEDPRLIAERQPSNPIAQTFVKIFHGPGHRVDRQLREGDEVAGFRVIDAPGHSAGHVVFWRESDRVLIVGDVFANMDTMTMRPGLQLPKDFLTPDPARNRASAKKLGELEPELVLFGHGPPLRDPRRFTEFCAGL
jgi:glyoxylase-like metal-dependent hydrolase (beta-lactamase superfamily II)